MKTNLQHVRANVMDLEKSIKWYTEILGFELDSQWPLENPNYADFISEEGTSTFSIMVDTNGNTNARFNFDVNDVDNEWKRLKEIARIIEEIHDTPYGTRKFAVSDPDGNVIGLSRPWGQK